MSRLTRKPIRLGEVKCQYTDRVLSLQGTHGERIFNVPTDVNCKVVEQEIYISGNPVLSGTYYRLIEKAIHGVLKPYSKTLILKGPGYKLSKKDEILVLELGYSHNIEVNIPKDLSVVVKGPTSVEVSGINDSRVADFASQIKRYRPVSRMKKGFIMEQGQVLLPFKKRRV